MPHLAVHTTRRNQQKQCGAIVTEEILLGGADRGTAVEDVLNQMAQGLGVAPSAVEEAVMDGERVKLARNPGHLCVTCYGTTIDFDKSIDHRSRLITSQVSVFVMPQGLVTVRKDDNFDIETVLPQRDDDDDLLSDAWLALLNGLLDAVVASPSDASQILAAAFEYVKASGR